jgi:phage N-6-adenine-methyltransferase
MNDTIAPNTLSAHMQVLDTEATRIGLLYREGRSSMAASVKCLIEAGRRLAAKKESLPHGGWLPWLEENECELGFGERTARMLMRSANRKLASDIAPEQAVAINRQIWGHNVRGTQGTGDNEWYTPLKYIDLARKVLGDIDLDPASTEEAQKNVQAGKFYTAAEDGLTKEWYGRVFLNPPYAQPFIAQFVEKLMAERRAGRVEAAIMLTHNYTDTAWFRQAAEAADAICFTQGRVKFVDADGQECAPTQGQAFFYFGNNVGAFKDTFADIGWFAK